MFPRVLAAQTQGPGSSRTALRLMYNTHIIRKQYTKQNIQTMKIALAPTITWGQESPQSELRVKSYKQLKFY